MAKIIGIDLGTTNSCVSVLDGDSPRVIAEFRGRSYYAFSSRVAMKGKSSSVKVLSGKLLTTNKYSLCSEAFDRKKV